MARVRRPAPVCARADHAVAGGEPGRLQRLQFLRQQGRPAPDEAADRLYNEGLYLLNAKHDPKEAAKKFEEVDRQHPYSEWARKALIMSSYAYYTADRL